MSKFMKPETALARIVEDERAPVMARYRALEQLAHPSLNMLRRLLVKTPKRGKPLPSRIKALASLKYAVEIGLKNFRREERRAQKRTNSPTSRPTNALGI